MYLKLVTDQTLLVKVRNHTAHRVLNVRGKETGYNEIPLLS